MGILDRFRKPEDPEEKTFHEILEKKEKTEGRRAYAEGHLKGIREHEKARGRMEAKNPQAGGFIGNAGKFLESINTKNVLFSGGGQGSASFNPMESPFGSSKKKKNSEPDFSKGPF